MFRAGVSLVRVDIETVDSSGSILESLVKEDFRVLDKGVEQFATNFNFEKEPLDLILLFDTGRAMGSKLHQIIRAVELGFHELQEGDRVCLMTFSGVTTEVAPFRSDMEMVNQDILLKILNAGFIGTSKPEAAASAAAHRFLSEPVSQRRRAVLMISEKAAARAAARPAVEDLWLSNAVFGQLMPQKPGPNRFLPQRENLLADQTGGETILAGDPGPAFQESVRRLRKRYSFYYPTPSAQPGSHRNIEVTLSPDAARRFPGAIVRARSGYVVAP